MLWSSLIGMAPNVETSKARQPILGLDLLRFFAALLVVAYHIGFIVGAPSNPFDPLLPEVNAPLGSPPMFWYGFVGVQIFFVISGFVIAYSAEHARAGRFARDRLVRLGPALWVCSSISLALFLIVGGSDVVWVLKRFVKDVIFYPFGPWLVPVVWTLTVEIAFYALVLALLAFGRFHWIGRTAFCLAAVSLTFHLISVFMGCHEASPTVACVAGNNRLLELSLIRHGCFFAVGIGLWLWLVKDAPVRSLWWVPLALAACILEIFGTVAEEQRLGVHAGYRGALFELQPVIVWLGAIALFVAAVRYNKQLYGIMGERAAKVVRLVGLSTYPLYLVHYASLGLFIWIFMAIGFGVLPALLGAWVAVVAMSFAIALWVEPPLQTSTRSLVDAAGSVAIKYARESKRRIRPIKRPRRSRDMSSTE